MRKCQTQVITNWVNAYLLSLATASATWRRPAQHISFIFGDGQRNLATARATRIFYLWRRPAQLATVGASFIFGTAASANAEMLNPGDKVMIVLFKRAFTLSCSKLMGECHMPCGITSLMKSPQELLHYISLGI